ncbi:MAG TPA: penicillin acylase family protein [Actinomycetota bacterium]|nr:penicillin acylase family protein [Actinomycetota bacterium]
MSTSRARWTVAVAAAASLSLLVAPLPAEGQAGPVAPYRAGDDSVIALNILPPGQGRHPNAVEFLQTQATGEPPEHTRDQLDMYDAMAHAETISDIDEYFKDASFGVRPDHVERRYSPREGVTVLRDAGYGVPHVYGETRSDVMFGAGYVSAEDRLFMMDVLRHAGRGRLSRFLGASPANLAMDRAVYRSVDYTEEELEAMFERLRRVDPRLGTTVIADIRDFAQGVNAYISEAFADPRKLPAEYAALQVFPRPWRVTDTVAIATLIGGRFGGGGGQELRNAAFLDALQEAGYPPDQARTIMADLRFAEDPEAWVHAERPFPFLTGLGRVDPDAVAMPDRAERVDAQMRAADPPAAVDGPFGPIRLAFPSGMSNAALIGSDLSSRGRPLAIFGPQTGYWSPQILNELDLHGPGIAARGIGFPGISMYVLLGRGRNYAWSATSTDGDNIDTFAVELCEPDGSEPSVGSDHYVRGRRCVPIYERTDSWLAKPSAGGMPDPSNPDDAVLVEMTTQRADVPTEQGFRTGIVQARGTSGGMPVAYVRLRSTYGAELDSALAYPGVMDPRRTRSAADFRRAFSRYNYTFNWFYLDDRDIAYQFTGALPLRAPGVDPDLPVWAERRWGWRGMVVDARKPFSVSPAKGYLTSWNNKPAPGFRAPDDEWSLGPVHRSQLLDERIVAAAEAGSIDMRELVDLVADAGTVDLRGSAVLPYMLRVLGTPADPRIAEAVSLLEAWVADGAHRRDLDDDGRYEHQAAVALMDEWWSRALDAAFRPVLGDAFDDVPEPQDDPNRLNGTGSAFQHGWYGHLQKDLRTVLGRQVEGRFSRAYCGLGALRACRADLLASLDQAVGALEERFGEDPATWDANEAAERIRFVSIGVLGQPPIDWQNRPTFQQVVEFGPVPRPR